MKIDHLTFAQLHKLKDESTLMRVTAAYHKALRREWDIEKAIDPLGWDQFTVSAAEEQFPWIARPWRRVIQFLRSGDLKSALRKSAASTPIPPSTHISVLRVLTYHGFPNATVRKALARIIVAHCEANGVPACSMDSIDRTIVYAATDELGIALLEYKPGLEWSKIQNLCFQLNVCIDRVFWWLPDGDRTGWRVNPCNWPVNTPDYMETARQLIDGYDAHCEAAMERQ